MPVTESQWNALVARVSALEEEKRQRDLDSAMRDGALALFKYLFPSLTAVIAIIVAIVT